MKPINPAEIRYIKLGRGGEWARHCFSAGEIHFGYSNIPHEISLAEDWDAVAQMMRERGRSEGKIKDRLREVRDFYSLGIDCLWITFADGHLWWAFAEPEVTWLGPDDATRGSRMRKTVSSWSKTDIAGSPLRIDELSTRLTQIASYQQTICRVKPAEYLLRRINAVEEPIVVRAREIRDGMTDVAREMIAGLHWADFETLVDLIFARSGWQRESRVGDDQADVDMILEQPATGERAFVQVKSKAGQRVLDDYIERFHRSGSFDRFFFVCHSPRGELAASADAREHVWVGDSLARATVRAGLFDWLIDQSK